MNSWEHRIIEAFLSRYPFSAAAAGGGVLRIRADSLFQNFGGAPLDERESFLEAAEALEKRGILTLAWKRRQKHEALSVLVCPEPAALFNLAGRPSPSALAEGARGAAQKAAGDLGPENHGPFFAFMAETLTAEDAVRGIDAAAVEDLAALVRRLGEGAAGPGPRALSVALYGNSKRLETLPGLFGRTLGRAERQGIPVPGFSALERSLPETMIAGRLSFFLGESAGTRPFIENSAGSIIGFPLATIERIGEVRPMEPLRRAPRALSVENKETFYDLARQFSGEAAYPGEAFDGILYSAGHPNGAVRALAALLAAAGFEFHHAGDLDPDGIIILQEMADAAGKPVEPFKMDRETFDRYLPCGRGLKPSMLNRLSLVKRGIPGMDGLIRRIGETKMGIEQEIIDYRENADKIRIEE